MPPAFELRSPGSPVHSLAPSSVLPGEKGPLLLAAQGRTALGPGDQPFLVHFSWVGVRG